MEKILTKNGSGGTIQEKEYEYTSIGEISEIDDLHNSKVYTYTYDNLSRLKTEVINGSTTSVSVNYNSIGNIISKTMNGNSFIYAYNSTHKHAVSSITYGTQRNFTYDNNGNMTYGWDFTNPSSPKSRSITYNADNMPTSITYNGSVSTNLLYDGMGTRVRKSVGSNHTYYIGEHFEIQGGTTTKYIFAGNLRLAQVKGGVRSYFHKDHLGSSTVMTDASGIEITSSSTEYMPFGTMRNSSSIPTNYLYTDQELDSENGLYNYNARLYDPFIGRCNFS